MKTPTEAFAFLKRHIKREWKIAFLAVFLLGLLIHIPAMTADIPNHDGLDSMYFDQNMITSGRWFLTVACGFSSYYTIPWLIGVLGLFFLALAGAALTEFLALREAWIIIPVSGLLAAFPALASNFAYVYTLDGYMLALLLAVLSALLTQKHRLGFLAGGACLAFSMGIYQAYLPFAVLLSIYAIAIRLTEDGGFKEKCIYALRYLCMGVLGFVLYYLILQALLKLQGKELANYQGINGISGGNTAGMSLLAPIRKAYSDFAVFTLKGRILFQNIFSTAAMLLLAGLFLFLLARICLQKRWWKNPLFYVSIALLALGLPIATNIILLVSPELTYHLLMRYQWVLYPILLAAFCYHFGRQGRGGSLIQWCLLCAVSVLVFHYAVADNIGYSNWQKRYEKTYAYCVRLLDRIEQTEGYYQGIPIAMVGVVGTDEYPVTDITEAVTGGMIGLSGDSLLYTGRNYQAFMKHYLGATLNFMTPEEMSDIYFSEEYIAMESFPGATSTKVVDGILYVRTENVGRD